MIGLVDQDRELFQPLMVSLSNHERCIGPRSPFDKPFGKLRTGSG